jgi:hypothetical protein
MSGKAFVCRLQNITPIEGADNIVQATMFGETIITTKSNVEGTLGLLFDCDTQLSHEYCSNNNLYRHPELNVNKEEKGYFDDNGRVRPIKLKGVKCSAMFIPVDSLLFTKGSTDFTEHTEFDEWNGIAICNKYVSKATVNIQGQGKAVKKNLVPTFKEHIDTEQLMKNLHQVSKGSLVTITEKLHGTSGRCGNLLVEKEVNKWERLFYNYILSPILYQDIGQLKSFHSYEFVVGSRRVVKSIGETVHTESGFYNTDIWSLSAQEHFEDKLYKGETVYYEIVGFLPNGQEIMSSQSNDKLKPFMEKGEFKTFTKKYGDTTRFDYGCKPGQYDVYVYRITMTNEDGEDIDYTWEQVKQRCERLGVKTVPELGIVYIKEDIHQEDKEMSFNVYLEQESQLFPNSVKEGICVRVDGGGMNPKIFKQKSFIFKVLEGIIKDKEVVDIEESQN